MTESPDNTFGNHKYSRIHLAVKGKTIIFMCSMSDSTQKFRQASRFEMDRAIHIDHQHLVNKLLSLNVKDDDIKKNISAIHQKDSSDATIGS